MKKADIPSLILKRKRLVKKIERMGVRTGDSDWTTGMEVGESVSFNEENTENNTGKGGSQFLLFLETDLIRKKMRIKYRQRKRAEEIFTATRTF